MSSEDYKANEFSEGVEKSNPYPTADTSTIKAFDQRIEAAFDHFISQGHFGGVRDPYLAVRQYTDQIQEAKNHHNAFYKILVSVCIVGMIASGYWSWDIAKRGNFRAAIVEKDVLGRTQFTQWAEQQQDVDPRIIREKLREFVEKWRSVSSDGATNKKHSEAVSAMIPKSQGSPARGVMAEWYQENNPGHRGKENIVTVDVNRIVPVPGTQAWTVDWVETLRTLQGERQGQPTRWTVTMILGYEVANTEEDFIRNPLRVMVTEIQWARQG